MVITIGVLLASALFLQVPATAPSTRPADLQTLISRLSDDSVAVRDAAQAELMRLDAGAVDLLTQARLTAVDPDVQLRLDALIVHYSESAAVDATRITLRFQNAPLKDVLDELSKQSKANFSDPVQEFGNQMPRITLDVENVTFWQALAALQQAGNVSIFPQPDSWRVMRNFGGNPLFSNNGIEAGAFLIQPMSASYQRSIGYMRNVGSGESFSLNMQMLTEPKIRLAQATGQFRLTRAVDSNGNDLIGASSLQNFSTGGGQSQIHMSTQLAYPTNPGATISELSGSVKLSMARRVETIAIDDFSLSSKPVERTLEGTKITIAPAETNPGQTNWLAVTVTIDANGDNASLQRMSVAVRQIRVVDQNNRAFQISAFQPNGASPQHAEFKISFMPVNPEVLGPFRLTLEIPTSFRDVEIPFTLRDLKMP